MLKAEEGANLLNDCWEVRQEQQQAQIINQLEELFKSGQDVFRFNPYEKLLCTIIQLNSQSTMVTWYFTSIIENLNHSLDYKGTQIPMFLNSITLFPNQIRNCLININPLLVRNYYNKHQFQFFFTDEVIADSVIYTSVDHPCLIIGTNYGRIFLVPMFQEQEDQIAPIIYIDCHHQSPITQLFITYNSSRSPKKSKVGGKEEDISSHQPISDCERGGHLISTSEDGTIAVINLNSEEIRHKLNNSTVQDRDKRRADQFMSEKNKNNQSRRRNSIQLHFSVDHYFQMVKASPQMVFSQLTFSPITKILEVKNI